MVVTDDGTVAAAARSLRNHGATRTVHERHTTAGSFQLAEHDRLGFNYRMTDLQGALGCAQMDRVDEILAERARQAARYDELLADLAWLRTPQVPAGESHGWQSYVCLYAPDEPTPAALPRMREGRDRLMLALEREGIATRPGTHAPVAMARYAPAQRRAMELFPGALMAEGLSIALPLFAGLTDAELEQVVDALRRLGP
jgi:perosamine synthetase